MIPSACLAPSSSREVRARNTDIAGRRKRRQREGGRAPHHFSKGSLPLRLCFLSLSLSLSGIGKRCMHAYSEQKKTLPSRGRRKKKNWPHPPSFPPTDAKKSLFFSSSLSPCLSPCAHKGRRTISHISCVQKEGGKEDKRPTEQLWVSSLLQ